MLPPPSEVMFPPPTAEFSVICDTEVVEIVGSETVKPSLRRQRTEYP